MIRALSAALAATAVVAVTGFASAHERDADRRLILDIEADAATALVSWTLPAGAGAEQLRSIADANGDGRVHAPTERLAQAMLVVPRMLDGIEVRVDGVLVALELEDLHIRDGALDGHRRGLEAMALVRISMGDALDDGAATLEVGMTSGDGHLRVEAQAHPPAVLDGGSMPSPGGPVRGPAVLHVGASTSIEVRRDTAP